MGGGQIRVKDERGGQSTHDPEKNKDKPDEVSQGEGRTLGQGCVKMKNENAEHLRAREGREKTLVFKPLMISGDWKERSEFSKIQIKDWGY